MATRVRVHAECVNASNPFHECTSICLEKIARGEGKKLNKKKSGAFILNGSLSFGKNKKGPQSQPVSPQAVRATMSPRSPLSNKKKADLYHSRPFSSPQLDFDESYSQDRSFKKEEVRSPAPVPKPANMEFEQLNRPRSPSNGRFTNIATKTPTKEKENGELPGSGKEVNHHVEKNSSIEHSTKPNVDFSFLGLSPREDHDDEEIQSVISDSCISVGRYHIKADMAPILQSIFDKYGDIAVNCQLQSASVRAHYLECLCSVVHELQSTTFEQLTNSKIKEMLAVLQDVEAVRIDIDWLHEILNELRQTKELLSQKVNNDRAVEEMKKELGTALEDLARKEKEVDEIKAHVKELQSCLSELELKSSEFTNAASSGKPKMDNSRYKSLVDGIL